MEHFVGEKNNFEDDSLINWEPVNLITEDWSYVVTLLGKRYQASSHVLNSLKFVNIFLWKAIQQRIAVIKSANDKSLNKFLSGSLIQISPLLPNPAQCKS